MYIVPAFRKIGILKLKYVANTISYLFTSSTNYSFRHTMNWIGTTCVWYFIGNVLSSRIYQLMAVCYCHILDNVLLAKISDAECLPALLCPFLLFTWRTSVAKIHWISESMCSVEGAFLPPAPSLQTNLRVWISPDLLFLRFLDSVKYQSQSICISKL